MEFIKFNEILLNIKVDIPYYPLNKYQPSTVPDFRNILIITDIIEGAIYSYLS